MKRTGNNNNVLVQISAKKKWSKKLLENQKNFLGPGFLFYDFSSYICDILQELSKCASSQDEVSIA